MVKKHFLGTIRGACFSYKKLATVLERDIAKELGRGSGYGNEPLSNAEKHAYSRAE